MDFVKDAVSKASGGGKSGEKKASSGSDGAQSQDYGDKAFSAVNDKAGWGVSKENQEKATDGARSAYEKYSGSKVPEKYSN